MKRIYIAGPVGKLEGRAARVAAAIEAGTAVARLGAAPLVPHLFDPLFLDSGFEYEHCMNHCFVWLAQCEAVYRIDGHSPGADRECEWAITNGLPVFTSIEEVRAWLR